MALPNYRLSSRSASSVHVHNSASASVPEPELELTLPAVPVQIVHPVHAKDLLTALEYLIKGFLAGGAEEKLHFSRLFLVGHSCSAHMLASIFLASPNTFALAPSPALLLATQAIILSEGIYNLDLLCRTFPTYRSWFVESAFGPPSESDTDGYAKVNVSKYTGRTGSDHIKWLIIHSCGDSLVDREQSEEFYVHLSDEVVGTENTVESDWSTITVEHNEMLKTGAYSQLVGDFICGRR